ncbi:MAG: guanine deaminase [Chthoniobacter sp.]|jgi:guanine deaminase|nr:guanine deaminase [Chthoniobacter sp.]
MTSPAPLIGIRGHLLDTPERGQLRARDEGAIVIENGLIAEIGDYGTLSQKPRPEPVRWIGSEHVAVFPGLIDLHTHLPQYPAIARGQSELLPWLRRYIFPLEREFTGPKARQECARFFAELARHGTTTAMIYTAIFEDSCDAAFEVAQASGARAIIGKMMMDVGSYGELPVEKILETSLAQSERLCQKWHGADQGRLSYAFSPRFALSCSREMMCAAATLANRHGAYIQTHLSENLGELASVREMCAWSEDYAGVYEKCGLFGPRTVLGHAIHLSDRELGAIANSGANIAHCPTANFFLSSGIMQLDRALDASVGVGLGTDVAAGPELNLWQVMRSAIEGQKARAFYEKSVRIPSPADVLFLATQGAANALECGDQIGSLEVAKEADLTLLDLAALLPYGKQNGALNDLSPDDILALCVYRGGPQATVGTFVRGRSIYEAPETAHA